MHKNKVETLSHLSQWNTQTVMFEVKTVHIWKRSKAMWAWLFDVAAMQIKRCEKSRQRKADERKDGGQMMEIPNPRYPLVRVSVCVEAIIVMLLWAHYRSKSEKIGDDEVNDDEANDDGMVIISNSACLKLTFLRYLRETLSRLT